MIFKRLISAVSALIFLQGVCAAASGSGTEAASFLNIPVGAEPAALGGAYSALSSDAYSPVWNAGGLGFLRESQLAAQHLSYLQSVNYEYAGFVHPFQRGGALGVSMQYLGTGNIDATNEFGDSIGSITNRYGAYSLSYGRPVSERLSLGLTGKIIDARLSNVGATAYAIDAGSMFRLSEKLTMAGVVTNVGSKMKFINESDPLPLAFHLGGAYRHSERWLYALEGVYHQRGLASMHGGVEWQVARELTLRAGYRTDTVKGQSAIAGVTVGVGLNLLGQTLSYAFVPMDQLGNTHYISLLIRFNDGKN